MRALTELRRELDALDRDLVALFERRMALSLEVAAYKQAHQLPVLDAGREAEVIASRQAMLRDPALAPAVRALFETVMAESRGAQEAWLREVRGDA